MSGFHSWYQVRRNEAEAETGEYGMNSPAFVKSARSCFGALFLIFVIAVSASAQAGRGSISGTVTDPAGALVGGAQLGLLNKATGVTQRTVSSAAGLYSFVS